MKNLLVVTDAPRIAGSEVWLLTVLPLIPRGEFNITVALQQAQPLDELAQRFEVQGIKVLRYATPQDAGQLFDSYDGILLQAWSEFNYLKWLKVSDKPKVCVLHDQIIYNYPLGVAQLTGLVYKYAKASFVKPAHAVVTVSAWAAKQMQAMGLRQVRSICNGVDVHKYAPLPPQERQAQREVLGWTRPTVLVPGRFTHEKNQMASVLTARLCPEYDFMFVGDTDSMVGNIVKTLKQRFGIDNAHILGRHSNMPLLYQCADIMLQPTLAENQSLATLEAMSSGLPIVSSGIKAQAEMMTHLHNGILSEVNPSALANNVRGLIGNTQLREQLSANARAHVLKHHTLSTTAERFTQVLQELLA